MALRTSMKYHPKFYVLKGRTSTACLISTFVFGRPFFVKKVPENLQGHVFSFLQFFKSYITYGTERKKMFPHFFSNFSVMKRIFGIKGVLGGAILFKPSMETILAFYQDSGFLGRQAGRQLESFSSFCSFRLKKAKY